MFRMLLPLIVMATTLCVALPAGAEVIEAVESGFALKHVVTVNGTPTETYRVLLEIGSWWDPAHTYSGDSRNMTIDARPGGLFTESLPDGGFAQHMQVLLAQPGRMLRMAGGLGPLQEHGVHAVMTVQLSKRGDQTEIAVTYNVGGYIPGGAAGWAEPVNSVLVGQFDRLRQRVAGTLPTKPQP